MSTRGSEHSSVGNLFCQPNMHICGLYCLTCTAVHMLHERLELLRPRHLHHLEQQAFEI